MTFVLVSGKNTGFQYSVQPMSSAYCPPAVHEVIQTGRFWSLSVLRSQATTRGVVSGVLWVLSSYLTGYLVDWLMFTL